MIQHRKVLIFFHHVLLVYRSTKTGVEDVLCQLTRRSIHHKFAVETFRNSELFECWWSGNLPFAGEIKIWASKKDREAKVMALERCWNGISGERAKLPERRLCSVNSCVSNLSFPSVYFGSPICYPFETEQLYSFYSDCDDDQHTLTPNCCWSRNMCSTLIALPGMRMYDCINKILARMTRRWCQDLPANGLVNIYNFKPPPSHAVKPTSRDLVLSHFFLSLANI